MRNMAGWRAEVHGRYGWGCPAGGDHDGPLEAHHLIFRSQGGPDVPENGITLCRRHHMEVHARRLTIDRGWLPGDTVDWLADNGYCRWDVDGQPEGRHWRNFTPMS